MKNPAFLPLMAAGLAIFLFASCKDDEPPATRAATVTPHPTKPAAMEPSTAVVTLPTQPQSIDTELVTRADPAPTSEPVPAIPASPLPETSIAPVAPPTAVPDNSFSASAAGEGMSDYTFAERSELFARVELVSGQFESALAELRGSSPKPESVDARAAALSAIDDARLVLTQKRDALGYATAETWQSAKSEFLTAWQSVLASYLKAKSASN